MTVTDTLLKRNRVFAARGLHAGLPLLPALRTTVIGCVDPRVDPAAVLDLDLGDAVIIRNIGGRFTAETFRTLAALRAIADTESPEPGPGWNLILLHHTDCAATRLSRNQLDGLGIDPAPAVDGPAATLAADIAAIRGNPLIPGELRVFGLVYDVATGLVDLLVPPAELRSGGGPGIVNGN